MFVCIRIVWFIWWIYTASLRKFSKFGFWKLFSKSGFGLKIIQNVLHLFLKISLNCFLTLSLYISLTLIWKCLWTVLWKIFENVFQKLFEICSKTFKTFSKRFKTFQNISKSCLKNFKHWEVNNLQLLDQLTIVETS